MLTACFLQNRITHKKYLRVWACLAKVMLTDPKKTKIGSKTSNYLFTGYAKYSVAYMFLVLKSDVLDVNTMVETKNVEFFEGVSFEI